MARATLDFDQVEEIIEKEGAKVGDLRNNAETDADSKSNTDAQEQRSASAEPTENRKTLPSLSRSRSRSVRARSEVVKKERRSRSRSRSRKRSSKNKSLSDRSESRSEEKTRRQSHEGSRRRSGRSRHDKSDPRDDLHYRDRGDKNRSRSDRRRDRRSPKRWESRSHRERDRDRERERDRERDRERERERERERDHRRSGEEPRELLTGTEERKMKSPSPTPSELQKEVYEASRKRFEEGVRIQNDEEDRRRKELEEARRDDMTVFVLNLPLKATERDVWKFFSDHAGKVRDIQVIRDNQSGKSKGVGYVEFYSQESVLKGLALSGHMIAGNVIKVQASQAEKNRQAKQAKIQAAEAAESGPTKLFVGNLIGPIEGISDDELRQLFNPFGEVVSSEINRDPYTQKSRGYGFVQYRRANDAREAMSALNAFEIAGQKIKVGFATVDQQNAVSALASLATATLNAPSSLVASAVQQLQRVAAEVEGQESERLDDEGGGLLSGPTRRIALMQKLQRPDNLLNLGVGLAEEDSASSLMTCNLCIGPLFSAEEVEQEGKSLLDEIADDVREECSKFGKLISVFVKRTQIDGNAWVKFATPVEAHAALMKLNGRTFGNNTVEVQFVSDVDWENFMKN
eukprot:GHVP01050831.1.p1 GENE.GHVP01050831.1~~GHVP01050831.1.p1  ORF type:complete len:649 (+),score=108.22 GHVP01050831.1:56-1948(+)